MNAKLTVTAEITRPIDGANAIFLACLAFLRNLGITSVEVNGDGYIIATRADGKATYLTPADLPDIPDMMPMAEAI